MKILIIIDSLGAGGAERSTAVLCRYLQVQQVPFQILCLDQYKEGFQQEMQKEGYAIDFLEKKNFFGEVKYIINFIKKGNFDLVHSILFRSNIRTRFAKLFKNFVHLESLVNTTYSQERFLDINVNQKGLKFYKMLDKLTAPRTVNHFHSITETVKQHYIEEIGLDPSKITVIPRGRKPILENYEDRPSLVNEKFQILNVGRQEFQKGQIFLLKAIKILNEKGNKIHLKILGRKGSCTKTLQEYIKENDLKELVTLEGFHDNVPDYLLKADLFVFPSLFEGLGGALIEAQAAGLPIACNDIPVLHEVVIKDQNAKFFDVHQIDSIVEAIQFFIKNPVMREVYGRKSLENFRVEFLETKSNEKMLNLYQSLT